MSEFGNWKRRRNAVLRNPTTADAMEFWDYATLGKPENPDVPLAGVHKARIQWVEATPLMIAESKLWLSNHGFKHEIERINYDDERQL
jgi:hypothetical protein